MVHHLVVTLHRFNTLRYQSGVIEVWKVLHFRGWLVLNYISCRLSFFVTYGTVK